MKTRATRSFALRAARRSACFGSVLFGALPVAAICSISCGEADPQIEPASAAEAPFARLQALDADLIAGSRGEDVAAVHTYLTAFGYFPNAELARDYPSWRPLVSSPPAAPDVFDEWTAEAIRRFQGTMGIPATGIVDEATREKLKMPRCGVPDGIEPLAGDDKFALAGGKWTKKVILWKIAPLPAGMNITIADAVAAARPAFASWQNQVSYSTPDGSVVGALEFRDTAGTPDITIRFQALGEGVVGNTPPLVRNTSGPATVTIGTAMASSALKMQGAMTHEIGHALGLHHSNIAGTSSTDLATMFPGSSSVAGWATLEVDDKVSISALYEQFHDLGSPPFLASTQHLRDVGVGRDGSIWALSNTDQFGGGFVVMRWNGTGGWQAKAAGGQRLAVTPSGNPWLVTSSGLILFTDDGGATWGSLNPPASGALDIGIGGTTGNGVLWITANDRSIWKLTSTAWVHDASNGAADKITVDALGRPWVLNSASQVYRYSSDDPTTGFWEFIPQTNRFPANLPFVISDLAVGPVGRDESGTMVDYVWTTAAVLRNGVWRLSLGVWDQQTTNKMTPTKNEWAPVGGTEIGNFQEPVAIGVDANANPVVINNPGATGQILTGWSL